MNEFVDDGAELLFGLADFEALLQGLVVELQKKKTKLN